MTAFDVQIGGAHYKHFKIQPIEFAYANNLNCYQFSVLKYICREKGDPIVDRLQDLEKAKHCIDMYIEELKREQEANGVQDQNNGESQIQFEF